MWEVAIALSRNWIMNEKNCNWIDKRRDIGNIIQILINFKQLQLNFIQTANENSI